MTAAAAVAAVAVLTTLIIPRIIVGARARGGHTPATSATQFAVALAGMSGMYSDGAKRLTIFNAFSGATVATIASPRHGMYFAGIATGNGRYYVAELRRPGVCRTWLYQFRLGPAGRPGPLAASPVRSIGDLLTNIAISEDSSTLAYAGDGCALATPSLPAHRSFHAHLGVIHLAGGETRQWTLPGRASVLSLSLTAHGTMLAYDTRAGKPARSAAYLLPTSAADGAAARHSWLAVASGRFGRSAAINSAVITPNGRQVYFTTSHLLPTSSARWQLRAVELSTGRIRVVGRYPGLPVFLSADPTVRHALVVDKLASASQPTRTPAPSPGQSTLPTPTPSASGESRLPTPTPSASGKSQVPTPTPSPTGSASPLAARLELVNLLTGRLRVIYPSTSWDTGGTIFVW
jgi:hypothetical protein